MLYFTYLPLLLVISGEAQRRKSSESIVTTTSSSIKNIKVDNLKVIQIDDIDNNTSSSEDKNSDTENNKNEGGRRGSSSPVHSSTIWSWDVWCQFQPVTLNCTDKKTQYYYDTQVDQCVIFSGCSTFKNHFSTKSDCELYCKGASYTKVKGLPSSMYCNLQPDVGVCMSYMMRYYFDLNEKACKEFAWGGCGGNQNRYESLESCKSECLPPSRTQSSGENSRRSVFIV